MRSTATSGVPFVYPEHRPVVVVLLNKSKIPLAIVVVPYRSVREGEQPVPLDSVIAKCRRCRTYIIPYFRFIDVGNLCVTCSPIFLELD
jgi:protein transport protein SEC24